jgi:cation transport regulator ChaC
VAVLFQYGSNCDEGQLNGDERLHGDARFISIAETVEDYKLVFDVWARRRGCAAADIVSSTGKKVWGILYEVPDYLIARETAHVRGRVAMDDIEAEGKVYKRESIAVRKPDGEIVTALTYRVIEPKEGLETNIEYVGYIVKGLRDHGVEDAYIETVKRTASENNPKIAEAVAKL